MSCNSYVSVIIPCAHDHKDLFKVVLALCEQTMKPKEIIIVSCSPDGGKSTPECLEICAANNIQLIYKYTNLAFPGDARNIGLGLASGDYIAFIDVKTIPRSNWLEVSLKLIEENLVSGVLGATFFVAHAGFPRLIRDGFFGLLPRKTLPGSVFERNVFSKTGQFIEWVRAGEDTEWILRLEVLKIPIAYSSSPLLDYYGLEELNLNKLLKKWYRNYSASRELPHFFPQKLLMRLVLYPLLVLLAFNWNYLIADWQIESPFYIGHITKIAAIVPLFIYCITRGLILPSYRGVGFGQLLPIRFIMIVWICILADLVKITVFTFPNKFFIKSNRNIG